MMTMIMIMVITIMMIVTSTLIEKDIILVLYIAIEIINIMRYLSRLHKEYLLNRGNNVISRNRKYL